MTIGEKIQLLRKKNGWSQETLAEKINVSRQALSKWESDAALPNAENIVQLGKLFGVTTDYLLNMEAESEAEDAAALQPVQKKPRDKKWVIAIIAIVILSVWVVGLMLENSNLESQLEFSGQEVINNVEYIGEETSLFYEESCEPIESSLSLDKGTIDYEVRLVPTEFNENTSIRLKVKGDTFEDEYNLKRDDNVFTGVITVPVFEWFDMNAILEDGNNTSTGSAGGKAPYFNTDMEWIVYGESIQWTGKGFGVNFTFEPMFWDESEGGPASYGESVYPENIKIVLQSGENEIYEQKLEGEELDDIDFGYTWCKSVDLKFEGPAYAYLVMTIDEGLTYEYRFGEIKKHRGWIEETDRYLKILNPDGKVLFEKQIPDEEEL